MGSYDEFLKKLQESIFVEDMLPEKADIIFLPGNGYPQMAQRAAALYQEGRAPFVLPSGKHSINKETFEGTPLGRERYGSGFDTEWEFLKHVLVCEGVPEEAVLREDQATFTYENAIFSRQVTDRAGLQIKSAILCCKNYHAARALMYYQLLYPDTAFYVAPSAVDGITKDNWMNSEQGISMVTGEIQRILCQFSLMLEIGKN